MWYVIQTHSGSEHDVYMWINTYVDQSLFERCFVPLYEDVWRKDGIGHINEMQSTAILNNYGELLSGLEGGFQTNIPYSMVSSMVSDQLSASEAWNVVTYAVTGSGDKNTTYSMPNQLVYVMNPNYSTMEKAEECIDKIENNEIVTID